MPILLITQLGSAWLGTGQTGTTNSSLAMTGQSVNVGDFVIAGCCAHGAGSITALAPASSLGNTYGSLGTVSPTNTEFALYGGFVTVGGTETITWSWSTTTGAAAAVATRWAGVAGTTGANAEDIAVTTNSGTTSLSITSGTSPATKMGNDLVIAFYGATGGASLAVLSAEAFTPAGTAFHVPDGNASATGTDHTIVEMSETLSGAAGTTQSFAATSSVSATVGCILVALKPRGVNQPSAVLQAVNRAATWCREFDRSDRLWLPKRRIFLPA